MGFQLKEQFEIKKLMIILFYILNKILYTNSHLN